jgi:hypothetical protein
MDLAEWILDHEVGWELRPRYARLAGGVSRAGYELELFARGPTLAEDPGSPECRALHEKLVAVARLAAPSALRPLSYVPFDSAFHLRPGQQPLPEIELLVDIGPLSDPTDAEEERGLLRQLEERLRQLGARPRNERSVPRRSLPASSGPAHIDHIHDRPLERTGASFTGETAQRFSQAA